MLVPHGETPSIDHQQNLGQLRPLLQHPEKQEGKQLSEVGRYGSKGHHTSSKLIIVQCMSIFMKHNIFGRLKNRLT